MALSFARLPLWWLGGKEKEKASNGSSVNSFCDWGLRGESETLKFYSVKRSVSKVPSSSKRNSKRKWKNREERKILIDKEFDVVLVPSDGVCLSGWESDDSDWSIGWLEPHAPDFQTDEETDCSFAVLVPCYRHDCKEKEEIKTHPNDYPSDGKKYIEQWLSSLHDY